jgi:hypothetical protein
MATHKVDYKRFPKVGIWGSTKPNLERLAIRFRELGLYEGRVSCAATIDLLVRTFAKRYLTQDHD